MLAVKKVSLLSFRCHSRRLDFLLPSFRRRRRRRRGEAVIYGLGYGVTRLFSHPIRARAQAQLSEEEEEEERRRRRRCKKSESAAPAALQPAGPAIALPRSVRRRTEYILVTAIMNLQFGSQRAKKSAAPSSAAAEAEDEYYAKFAARRRWARKKKRLRQQRDGARDFQR